MNAISKRVPADMPLAYYEKRDQLAPALMKIGAVLTAESDHPLVFERPGPNGVERGFKLKLHESKPDAPLSPIYLNLRTPENPKKGPLTPDIVRLAATCMAHICLAEKLRYDAVVGVPRAGDPFAEAYSELTGAWRLEMEKSEQDGKRHIAGVKNRSDVPKEMRKILLLDDLLTEGGSKIEAILNLHEVGFDVSDLLTLVDREQGGTKELMKLGVTVYSVFTLDELLDVYVETGEMSQYMRAKILQYLLQV